MTIDGFTIHPGVIWVNETTDPKSAQQIERTLLMNTIILHTPITKREIVLEAREGAKTRGVFERGLVEYLMAAETNGTPLSFTYRGTTRTVVVKAGGVDLTPKKEVEQVAPMDYYTGTVTFQEI